ncbi:uncharacterized protein LOC113305757 [Papaver somniferum]|uniref:uncharacterized protein LOC113305757 n=1 Tax=Papaver somniferum TaxID=3469 RepID=UPI000E6FF4F1|nr:uncharacterized protein LOC113305757 [Papaver somniferum]
MPGFTNSVLANRLKKVMHKLVSEFQGTFIKGKQILDGALIAGECVDSRLNSKKPGILCKVDMEKILSKLVDDAVLRKKITGFQVEDEETVISHLQFADDTLLFVDANVEDVRRLLIILTSFELLKIMKLKLEKSSMISVGADEFIGDLALELGCKVEKLPFKYLGLPIGATTRCTSVWEEVIKRMEVKLVTWKKRFLSKAGSVEKKLNKLMRNFLWDSTEERIRMFWVSWLKICKPKHLGGLGIQNLRCTSKALKAKWVWRYVNEKRDLWRRIVQQKMKNGVELVFFGPLKNRYPTIFKALSNKNASLLDMIENGRLKCQTRRRLYQNEQFEWDMLCNDLGHVHGLNEEEYVVEVMEDFSVKKCYELLVQDDTRWDFNRFLWKQGIPPKVSFMLWATFHDSLPTLSMLKHKGLDIENTLCLFCKRDEECAYHFFVGCSLTHEVWCHFIKAFKLSWVAPISVKNLFLAWNLNNLHDRCKRIWWKVIYAVCWQLWTERNRRNNGGRVMTVEEVLMLVKQNIVLGCS